MKKDENLFKLSEKFIKGTKKNEYIKIFSYLLGDISHEVKKSIKVNVTKVYIHSKELKHIHDRYCHDKKQEDVYYFLIKNLYRIIKDPDYVKDDKKKKKADFVFLKKIDGNDYACPIEIEGKRKGKKILKYLTVVSAFKVKKGKSYLSEELTFYHKKQKGKN